MSVKREFNRELTCSSHRRTCESLLIRKVEAEMGVRIRGYVSVPVQTQPHSDALGLGLGPDYLSPKPNPGQDVSFSQPQLSWQCTSSYASIFSFLASLSEILTLDSHLEECLVGIIARQKSPSFTVTSHQSYHRDWVRDILMNTYR